MKKCCLWCDDKDKEDKKGVGKKCLKPGVLTRNPFFNFLRKLRAENCGLTIIQIAKKGGIEWRGMTDAEKCPFVMQAFSTPRKHRKKYRKSLKASHQ